MGSSPTAETVTQNVAFEAMPSLHTDKEMAGKTKKKRQLRRKKKISVEKHEKGK